MSQPIFIAIEGEPRPAEQPRVVTRDGGLLETVGTIAPIVASIVKWREKRKQASNRGFHVVIEDARGNRISLDHATPEQITSALQTLQP